MRKYDTYTTHSYKVSYYFNSDDPTTIYLSDDKYFVTDNIEATLDDFILEEVILKGHRYDEVVYCHEEIMKNYKDNVAYHISSSLNHNKIMSEGLIANGNICNEVLITSIFLDSHKTHNIPKDFFRSMCVYAYPEISIYELRLKQTYRHNETLYAIDLTDLDWRIASEGLSGFCLCFNSQSPQEVNNWLNSKDLKKYAKLYWKNCFSKTDSISYGKNVSLSDKNWGLDELLIMYGIEKERITHIGDYNEQGCFMPTSCFKKFVKEEHQAQYLNVLEKV